MYTYEPKGGMVREWERCTPADVEIVERELRVRLPEDYKAFLLEHNGVMFPDDLVFAVRDRGGDPMWGEICRLYGIGKGEDEQRNGIIYRQNDYDMRRRLPRNLIAIGHSHILPILLSVAGRDRGSVYYWRPGDYYEDTDSFPSYTDLCLAARSFQDFWDRLVPYDGSEEPDPKQVPPDL